MLHNLTITKFHEGLTRGEFTALHVVEEYFKMIEARDPEIGAYLALFKDGAYEDAEQVDLAMARGEKLGPLAGVPRPDFPPASAIPGPSLLVFA